MKKIMGDTSYKDIINFLFQTAICIDSINIIYYLGFNNNLKKMLEDIAKNNNLLNHSEDNIQKDLYEIIINS